jgi:hypothetical protein
MSSRSEVPKLSLHRTSGRPFKRTKNKTSTTICSSDDRFASTEFLTTTEDNSLVGLSLAKALSSEASPDATVTETLSRIIFPENVSTSATMRKFGLALVPAVSKDMVVTAAAHEHRRRVFLCLRNLVPRPTTTVEVSGPTRETYSFWKQREVDLAQRQLDCCDSLLPCTIGDADYLELCSDVTDRSSVFCGRIMCCLVRLCKQTAQLIIKDATYVSSLCLVPPVGERLQFSLEGLCPVALEKVRVMVALVISADYPREAYRLDGVDKEDQLCEPQLPCLNPFAYIIWHAFYSRRPNACEYNFFRWAKAPANEPTEAVDMTEDDDDDVLVGCCDTTTPQRPRKYSNYSESSDDSSAIPPSQLYPTSEYPEGPPAACLDFRGSRWVASRTLALPPSIPAASSPGHLPPSVLYAENSDQESLDKGVTLTPGRTRSVSKVVRGKIRHDRGVELQQRIIDLLMAPLTTADLEVYQYIIGGDLTIEHRNETLASEDISRLVRGAWYNDVVVNVMCHSFNSAPPQLGDVHWSRDNEPSCKYAFVSTQAIEEYKAFIPGGKKVTASLFRVALNGKKPSYFDVIYTVGNFSHSHWFLIVYYVHTKRFEIVDSCSTNSDTDRFRTKREAQAEKFLDGLAYYSENTLLNDEAFVPCYDECDVAFIERSLQQNDAFNCGVFCVINAIMLVGGCGFETDFVPSDVQMVNARKRLAVELARAMNSKYCECDSNAVSKRPLSKKASWRYRMREWCCGLAEES